MKSIVVENKSRYGFDETVDRLISEAEQREWKVPFVHDLQQSLAKSGKEVRPVKVIEICKPAYSGKMLELNDERIMSVMMPCRISVYMKDDGETTPPFWMVSTVGRQPERIAEVMKAASDETFEILKSVMK